MKLRDMVGFILFFLPALILQIVAAWICGPYGRDMIVEAYANAIRKMLEEEIDRPDAEPSVKVGTLTEAEEAKIRDKLSKVPF